jgi:hypothetical protein
MSFKSTILGTVCVVAAAAFAASPALADFNGTLQGDYSNLSADHGGGSANNWGGSGTGEFGLGMGGLSAQVDTGYHEDSSSGGGASINDWNVDGSLFWLGSMGRVGAAVGYQDLSGDGLSGHLTNYGGFAEWYANHWLTVSVKGGGLDASISGFNTNGSYIGGQALVYPMHDLSIAGTVDYLSISSGHFTNYGVNAEWLVSESTPISVFGGYTRTEISSGGSTGINVFMIGLKFYCNGNGAATLEDRQRSGTVGWASQIAPIYTF